MSFEGQDLLSFFAEHRQIVQLFYRSDRRELVSLDALVGATTPLELRTAQLAPNCIRTLHRIELQLQHPFEGRHFFEVSGEGGKVIRNFLGGGCIPRTNLLAPHTPILADFWIFSDQAQLLDPESAASKEPRSGLVA